MLTDTFSDFFLVLDFLNLICLSVKQVQLYIDYKSKCSCPNISFDFYFLLEVLTISYVFYEI